MPASDSPPPLPATPTDCVLAIDAGTTGVTALLVAANGSVSARGYREFAQHFPAPGEVEHDPEEIWQATLAACAEALQGGVVPVAIGIANQRETVAVWDRETLAAPRRAIVWQDRRTSAICERLRGAEDRIRELTGLRLDPYFSGTKLTWLREAEPEVWAGIVDGRLCIGTIDTYLIARLTAGAAYVTDSTNASRTLLYDIRSGAWSPELLGPLELDGLSVNLLPELVPSYGVVARTEPGAFLGLDVPISGIAGDQQAAMVGQGCFAAGDSKCTYGTGAFLLVHTGTEIVRSAAGLLTTIALGAPDGTRTFALEGSVFVSGAAVQWLRDGLGILDTAAESETLAASVPDSGGVVFVPALAGLGAPYWDPDARGTIVGITRGTTPAHLARATLDAMAQSVADVVEVLEVPPRRLRVDGGAAANNLLLQFQADLSGLPVERPAELQTTAMGAAFLAGRGVGLWQSEDEICAVAPAERTYEPSADPDEVARRRASWKDAVSRSRRWVGSASA